MEASRVDSLSCPQCGGRNVGKVGTGQFYCWDCYIEFSMSHRGIRMYTVEADGELTRIESAVTAKEVLS